MLINFNINRALFALEDFLKAKCASSMSLTVRPFDSAVFKDLHKDYVSYASFISGTYLIEHHTVSCDYKYYLFIRNGINKATSTVTTISSVELGYIDAGLFISTYKKHLLGNAITPGILESLLYESDLEHKMAIAQFINQIYLAYLQTIQQRES